jgi:hypothetical protein
MDAQLSAEAVENLVTQFSSALDFYRELVQNSIDAGSSNVDVWLQFVPGEGAEGVIEIHVDDFGEGMNEEIIDDQLTQLFASSKEDDLTKIGKFGIGFVSVFALGPKGVLVHTGRDGEFWEVFFYEDRSFTKTRCETPIEGTQITLFLAGDRAQYIELVRGSRKTLKRWCSHSDTEVNFEDRAPADGIGLGVETINEPFVAAGDCAVAVDQPGTELSLAYSETPSYGFYNRGLALAVTDAGADVLDERADRYRHVAMKIKSRYLEHTLSRETVMRDEHYEKAMEFLDAAAAGPLRSALVAAIGTAAAVSTWDLAAITRYRRLLRYLSLEPRECIEQLRRLKLLRTVDGETTSLQDVADAAGSDGWVYVATAPSSLTAHLREQGTPVVLSLRDHADEDPPVSIITNDLFLLRSAGIIGFVKAKLGTNHFADAAEMVATPEQVLVQTVVDPRPPAQAQPLLDATARLLKMADAGYKELRTGEIHGRPDDPRLFVLGRKFGPIMSLPPSGTYHRGFLEKPRALLNRNHPHFRRMLELSGSNPQLATYCLAKSLILTEDRKLELDYEMVEHATAPLRGGSR